MYAFLSTIRLVEEDVVNLLSNGLFWYGNGITFLGGVVWAAMNVLVAVVAPGDSDELLLFLLL